jgi:bacterioferritin (cytochrome b1)
LSIQEAQPHADRIVERIAGLDGQPEFYLEDITRRSLSQYTNAGTLHEMIREEW